MLDFKFKLQFFDRKAVTDAVSKARRSVLSRIGAFVRRTAKNLLRRKGTKKNRTAAPGEPPRQHVGKLRDLLFFGYDSSADSVVIGPAKFREGKVPNLLEFGGDTVIKTRRGSRPAKYNAFPYMGPALRENLPKIPPQWANSVRG